MRKPIYSNRLDFIYNTISNTQTSEQDLALFKNAITSLDNAHHSNIKNKRLSYFPLHSQAGPVDKTVASRESIINNVKSRNSRLMNKNDFEKIQTMMKSKIRLNKNEKGLDRLNTFCDMNAEQQHFTKFNLNKKTRNCNSELAQFSQDEIQNKMTSTGNNFYSMSTDLGSQDKTKPMKTTFTTFGAESTAGSRFNMPSILKKTPVDKIKRNAVKFKEETEDPNVNNEKLTLEALVKEENSVHSKRLEKYRKLMNKTIMKKSKSLGFVLKSPKNDLLCQETKSEKINSFKTSTALNRFLISDYFIGEKFNHIENSKKKLKMTAKFFKEKEKKTLENIQKKEELRKYEITKSHKETKLPERKITQKLSGKDISRMSSNSLNLHLKSLKSQKNNKYKQESKKISELIRNVSIDYEEDTEECFNNTRFNRNNLDRVIRIRNIVKKGHDIEKDNVGLEEIQLLKNERAESDCYFLAVLKTVGPPAFIKTKFKNETIKKYNNVTGRYLGCFV